MEGDAESLVSLVTALVAEQVVLQIITDGEERTACRVHDGVAVGADGALHDGSWRQKCQCTGFEQDMKILPLAATASATATERCLNAIGDGMC